ncbi:MAG: aldo/keto reductase [Planctomycetota bacterium]|nr:aldo/keto reductase [Planctomycetota bacterium]
MGEMIEFGRTGLTVSRICYGSWQTSHRFWGHLPREDFVAAMRRAFEAGVNFFDTADAYGDGLGEEIMGEALAPLPRDRIVVTTKVYHHFYPDGHRHPDLSGAYIERECEASLRRLRMDYIDVYLCHAFDPMTHPEETTAAMEKLKKAGKIRSYGASNYTVEQLRMARRFGDYAVLQPSYNLLERGIENDLLPYCLAEKIAVMVYGPLCKGLLTGKYSGEEKFEDLRRNNRRFQGEEFKKTCEKVRGLKPIADRYGLTITQLVLAATLTHPAVHCVIVGVKKAAQIEEAAGAMGKKVDREDYFAIRRALEG